MHGKSKTAVSLPFKDRLSLKLILLFVITFLTVLTGGLIYDVLATMREKQETEDASLAQPALKPIEPKIESELGKVLAFDSIPNVAEIKDPFSDRAGISGDLKTALGKIPDSKSAPQQTSAAKGKTDNSSGNSADGLSPQNNSGGAPEKGINYAASTEATNARIRSRDERIRLGQDGGPESEVLAVDDLLPVGMVSGGSGKTEIMLYSQALMKTFSFPVGTPFYDGWLAEWRPEGVVFGYTNQNGAVLPKNWSRSIKPPTSGNSAVKVLPERMAATGYDD